MIDIYYVNYINKAGMSGGGWAFSYSEAKALIESFTPYASTNSMTCYKKVLERSEIEQFINNALQTECGHDHIETACIPENEVSLPE